MSHFSSAERPDMHAEPGIFPQSVPHPTSTSSAESLANSPPLRLFAPSRSPLCCAPMQPNATQCNINATQCNTLQHPCNTLTATPLGSNPSTHRHLRLLLSPPMQHLENHTAISASVMCPKSRSTNHLRLRRPELNPCYMLHALHFAFVICHFAFEAPEHLPPNLCQSDFDELSRVVANSSTHVSSVASSFAFADTSGHCI
jgi:hypothetical protein